MISNEKRQAVDFLETLDPTATQFTFQTFDNSREKRPELTRVLHSSLDDAWETLQKLNEQGAGIYVNIQETNLTGRKKEDIVNIRSVFIEDDIGLNIDLLPLEPTMVVKTSPGKQHIYFVTHEKQSVKTALGQFKNMMNCLIEIGSDPNVKDISRVLRIPGFKNWKREEPFDIVLCFDENSGTTYNWADLVDAFEGDKTPEDEFFFKEAPERPEGPLQNARIYGALQHISPDCEYNDWLKIGMAIHHASRGGKQGYELFYQWSSKGQSFNTNDWPNKWHSFRNTSKNPVQIGTLYRMAKAEGWTDQYLHESALERMHIRNERENNLRDLNKYLGVVSNGGKTRIVEKRRNGIGNWYYQFADVLAKTQWYSGEKVPVVRVLQTTSRVEMKNRFTMWMDWKHKRRYDDIIFEPSDDIQLDFKDPKQLPDSNNLNLYTGLSNPGKPGIFPHIQKHIYEVWCKENQSAYDYIVGWMGYMFQHPGKPIGTCTVIKSTRQGAGKNIIANILVDAFGTHGVMVSTDAYLTGGFNALTAESVFILLGEAVWAGSNKAKSYLKSLITEPYVVSERKFENAIQIKNCSHLMFLSNEDWIAPVEAGDRRYFVLDCDNKYAQNFDYFSKLARHIKEGEGDAFIHYLRTMDLSNFNPSHMPKLEDDTKFQNIMHGFDTTEEFIHISLTEKSFLFALGDFTNDPINLDEPFAATKKQVYDSYSKYFSTNRGYGKYIDAPTMFGRKFTQILGKGFKAVRLCKQDGFEQPYPSGYRFKSINELRSIFTEYVGTHIEWPKEEAPPEDEASENGTIFD